MSPTLLEALTSLPRAVADRGRAGRRRRAGWSCAHDVGTQALAGRRHARDEAARRVAAARLRRRAGAARHAGGAALGAPTARWRSSSGCWPRRTSPGYVLFSPGPVMTSARVKAALVHHDVCHRDGDYSAVVERLQAKLRPVFGASPAHEMLLLTGSGTAAMEMAISSVDPARQEAAGGRERRLRRAAGRDRRAARHPARRCCAIPGASCRTPRDVARALDGDPEIAGAAMIHARDVGRPAEPGGRDRPPLPRARRARLIVDAVSALGAEDVDVVRDGVDICYSSANKCLHSVSGVSFLCVAPEVWPRIAGIAPRVYYLDMLRHRRYLRRAAPDAVHAGGVVVLRARDRARRAGRAGRRAGAPRRSIASATLRIRRVFADLGFESFTQHRAANRTPSRCCRLPDGLTVEALYDGLKRRGFIVYRAKGELADATSRSRTWASSPTRPSTLSSPPSPRWSRRARGGRAPAGALRPRSRSTPCARRSFAATAGPR